MKNKFGSLLLSLLIAVTLWLYVITAVSPGSKESYSNIPVVLEGESVLLEHGLMITGTSSTSVTMVLSGNRTDLSKVDSRNITVKVDLSKVYEPGTVSLGYTHSFPGNVASNAFVVESKYPEKINFTVERRLSKDVDVEVHWNGSAPEGFLTDRENRVLDYPAVNIVGPQSVVDQIAKAVIEVDLNEQRESISQDYHYTLCNENDEPVDAELIVTNVEQVHLEVKIERVKDVQLVCTVVEGGGARAEDAEVQLNVDTIRVAGSEAALELLGDTISVGTVNLAEITRNTTLSFAVTLPEGVKNLTGVTEVTAEVKLNGLAIKEFTVQNIRAVNVPLGMAAEIITQELTVVIRGPSSQIARLTENDFSITVDFSGAELGTNTYRAAVTFDEGFSDVGALRVESVSATLAVSGSEE